MPFWPLGRLYRPFSVKFNEAVDIFQSDETASSPAKVFGFCIFGFILFVGACLCLLKKSTKTSQVEKTH